jgi:hypothetical protein
VSWNLLELRRRSQRHWGRRLALAGALFAVLLTVGFVLGVPPLLRAQIRERLTDVLGRPVTVARATLNPMTGTITVDGLAIAEPDGSPWLSWDRLQVNLGLWARLFGSWRLEEVRLAGFVARVAVGPGGELNLSDLLARRAPPGQGETPPRASVIVDQLVVENARILLSDATRSPVFTSEIGPLSFTLSQFHSIGDPRAPYSFSAKTESGEGIEWRGSLSAGPFRSAGDFSLSGVSLPKYRPYYAALLRGRLEKGTLSFRGSYSATVDADQPKITLTDGTLEVRDVHLRGDGDTPTELALPRLDATGIHGDLGARSLTIGRISAAGGRAALRRGPSGLVTPWALPAPAASSPQPAARDASLTIGEISLEDFAATFTDTTPPQPVVLRLEKLALTLRELATRDPVRPSPVDVRGSLGGGSFAAAGTLAFSPSRADLRVELRDLPLPPFGPYLESHVDLWLAKGRTTSELRLSLADGEFAIAGDARISDLALVDNAADEEVLGWSGLAVTGLAAASAERRLHAGGVTLTDPALRVSIRPDGRLNLNALRRPATAGVQPASDGIWDLSVERFETTNGRIELTDRSQPTNPRFSLTAVAGTVTGLAGGPPAPPAKVRLQARLGAAAPVLVEGTLSPFVTPASADLTLRASGVDLSPAGPYVERHLGYALERGALRLDARLRLANRRLDAAPVVTLEGFTLGARTSSPDATKLPVALALALLTDREGRAVIDVPVQGSLDDPEFRFGRVVWRIVTNVLTKAATSPFALLGSAFGGGAGEDLATIRGTAGTAASAEGEGEKRGSIARALASRPGLRLELTGRFDPEEDRRALLDAAFIARVRDFAREYRRARPGAEDAASELATADERIALALWYAEAFPERIRALLPTLPATAPPAPAEPPPSEGFLPRLLRLLGGRPTPPPAPAEPSPDSRPLPDPKLLAEILPMDTLAAHLRETLSVTDDQVRALAQARAEELRAWLAGPGGIDPARILIVPPAAGAPGVGLTLR